jgi:hypothetical protein
MLMEDLGQPIRDAGEHEAGEAAVVLHRVPVTGVGWLPHLGQSALTALPQQIAARAKKLGLPEDIPSLATAIASRSAVLAEGTGLPSFGLCHSEFHPTSLHISGNGWRLLDFARAFTGPGLLDLASWQGTTTSPDPDALASLIAAYIRAGGPTEASAARGGLTAQDWALGWHRVWISGWYVEQIERGWAGNQVNAWTSTISRHLAEATTLLRA